MKKNIWYTATETLNSDQTKPGFNWQEYIASYQFHQVEEIITLDFFLNCPVVELDLSDENDFEHVVVEDGSNLVTNFFTNLDFVVSKTKHIPFFNLLAIIKEPVTPQNEHLDNEFEFIGYDLIETFSGVSALTNCGGFEETFLNSELNKYGLIYNYQRALDIQRNLVINNPTEPHANCCLFEVWRHKTIGRKHNI